MPERAAGDLANNIESMTADRNAPSAPAAEPAVSKRRRVACGHCNWSFVLPTGKPPSLCPHCCRPELMGTAEEEIEWHAPVEVVAPPEIAETTLLQQLDDFGSGFWLAPKDLNAANLSARLQQVFFPMWLVDSDVEAQWQAEAGFDYEVVSHQDAYDEASGGWRSRQVTETRVRWEPRVGTLKRRYHNIAAPALESHGGLIAGLGTFDLGKAQPLQERQTACCAVVLPDRPPEDGWQDAVPSLHAAGAAECARAARADHIRAFSWSARFDNHNWTQVLLPLYTSYYRDDEQQVHPVLIHGQTGQLFGRRRASMQRARRVTLVLVVLASILLAASLLTLLASILLAEEGLVDGSELVTALGGLGLLAAFGLAFLSILPVAYVRLFNRGNRQTVIAPPPPQNP